MSASPGRVLSTCSPVQRGHPDRILAIHATAFCRILPKWLCRAPFPVAQISCVPWLCSGITWGDSKAPGPRTRVAVGAGSVGARGSGVRISEPHWPAADHQGPGKETQGSKDRGEAAVVSRGDRAPRETPAVVGTRAELRAPSAGSPGRPAGPRTGAGPPWAKRWARGSGADLDLGTNARSTAMRGAHPRLLLQRCPCWRPSAAPPPAPLQPLVPQLLPPREASSRSC